VSMAKAHRSLAGKIVAITGGARGIGRATAAALIAHGARVAIGDIDAPLAQQAASELGGGTLGLPLDVTSTESFEAFLSRVERDLGPLDVLINNAGIMPVGPLVSETDSTTRRLVDINLHGVIIGSKLALGRFLPRGRGHLVNIASAAGKGGFSQLATYCASKHAVVGLSEAIRAEVRSSGIDVSIVMPVGVNTELYSGLAAPRTIPVAEPEHVAAAIVEALQTGRVDVYVPRRLKTMFRLLYLMPRPLADFSARVLKLDSFLAHPDQVLRSAYQQRTGDKPELAAAPPAPGAPGSAPADATDATDATEPAKQAV
jgi:NAD(P)-dependent dehydrogenase (short-subunit alcohol dehydrogenase family)